MFAPSAEEITEAAASPQAITVNAEPVAEANSKGTPSSSTLTLGVSMWLIGNAWGRILADSPIPVSWLQGRW